MADVRVLPDAHALARTAAALAAEVIVSATGARPLGGTRGSTAAPRHTAHVMLASGTSQLGFLGELTQRTDIDWSRVVGFHMDEYLGLSAEHPASFARYMREHVIERVHPDRFELIDGRAHDAVAECDRYAALLLAETLDLCCLGIGENGHLAFNDPPVAEFDDPLDVKIVTLDDACKRQQVGEGHFPTLEAVPPRAITVTIPALLRARRVIAIVPEARKAAPVRRALTGPVSTACPASVLQRCPHATVLLDPDSAAGLTSAAAS